MSHKGTLTYEEPTRFIITGRSEVGSQVKISETVTEIVYTIRNKGVSVTGYNGDTRVFSKSLREVKDANSDFLDLIESHRE
jgi:hypothetical protein